MLGNLQKLVSLLKNFVLFLRKPKLHDVKQNEKYPYVINFIVFVGWGQFIMISTQTILPRGLTPHDGHPKYHIKEVNSS